MTNSLMFHDHHSMRDVNSLYLDTPMLARYEENLSGISTRKKVRIRWYNDLNNATSAKLEFKHRQASKGYKVTFDTSLDLLKPNFSWFQELKYCYDQLTTQGRSLWGTEQTPIIICRYRRQYLISQCNRIRVTIDSNIVVYEQRYQFSANLERYVSLGDYVLMEIKTDAENEQLLSQLMSTCPLRPSRHSKYVNGIRNLIWR
nr:polyphosphate polymerase domain-containing protein [Vibrio marisflavi]